MDFISDKQTLDDLNLTGRFRKDSVINIFDRTRTRAGRMRLEKAFSSPFHDAGQINARSRAFSYYADVEVSFPFKDEMMDSVEYWFGASSASSAVPVAAGLSSCRLRQMFSSDDSYTRYVAGLSDAVDAVLMTADLLEHLPEKGCPLHEAVKRFRECFDSEVLGRLAGMDRDGINGFSSALSADMLLRCRCRGGVEVMLDLIYELDFALSVSSVAVERGLSYPHACEDTGQNFIDIRGVWHPAIVNAVANDIRIDFDSNVYFLTGVNMAGKSTFMKSVATATYLAHLGFPVPASGMDFSPLDGIYTSINVPDNIAMGYSHFYAEVLRVKSIAQKVHDGQNLLIIFDELFKGTNVKDAYDATLAVTEAFAAHRNCLYIISTHIVETGAALSRDCTNVQFHRLSAELDGDRPVYTYRLADGISSDRHGMTIIRNEHILETIRGAASGN